MYGSQWLHIISLLALIRTEVTVSPLKKVFISVNESLLKMMKNAFYLMLKDLFVLEIF